MTTVAGVTCARCGEQMPDPYGLAHLRPYCASCWQAMTMVAPAGSTSCPHDALAAAQDVGEVLPATPDGRRQALRQALLHRSQW